MHWINFNDEEIDNAASLLGITRDEFIKKYGLVDDIQEQLEKIGKTKEEYFQEYADRYKITVKELKRQFPDFGNHRLFIKCTDEKCPLQNDNNDCSIYGVHPRSCAAFPTQEQLAMRDSNGRHKYREHCPAIRAMEKNDDEETNAPSKKQKR